MSSYNRRKTIGNTEWLVHDRFGMFIHFGLFAMPARHEWVKKYEYLPQEVYDKYFKYFNPDMFDARDLARRAKEAGMKYAVLTTRHHEAFALFDTQYSDYKITNTPYGRDLVQEYVDAFRAEGLKIGFYYSLLDWNHPDYRIDQCHPLCNQPDVEKLNEGRNWDRYVEFMHNQVRELMTNYGKIDIIFFDYSWSNDPNNKSVPYVPGMDSKGPNEWQSEKLVEMIRSLQPEIVINNRLGIPQDTTTPEQRQLGEWPQFENGEYMTWEACQTFSGSWGYHRDEMTWKSPQMLIEMLIKTVATGGNLLMNVGPCARGYIDDRACAALDTYAQWMKYNSRSIYGCTKAEPEFTAPDGTWLTQSEDGSRLYVHLFSYPFKVLTMENIADKIDYAQFLHDGSEVRYEKDTTPIKLEAGAVDYDRVNDPQRIRFTLPVIKPNQLVPVIEIYLKQ